VTGADVRARLSPVLDLWRTSPVVIDSALTPEQASARLRDGIADYVAARKALSLGERLLTPSQLEVRGWCAPHSVQLRVVRPMSNGNTIATLTAEIVPSGSGSRLSGTIGSSQFARVFMACWLASITLFVFGGLASVVSEAGTGSSVVFLLFPLLMLMFGLGFVALMVRQGKREQEFLIGWVRQRLGPIGPRAEA
jgi:hypothetical protein